MTNTTTIATTAASAAVSTITKRVNVSEICKFYKYNCKKPSNNIESIWLIVSDRLKQTNMVNLQSCPSYIFYEIIEKAKSLYIVSMQYDQKNNVELNIVVNSKKFYDKTELAKNKSRKILFINCNGDFGI